MTDLQRRPGTAGRNVLATGHEVSLPLSLRAHVAGAVYAAPLEELDALLPGGVAPLRVTPRRGAVTLLAVDYDRVGDGAVAPYEELSVQVPAVPARVRRLPVAPGWLRATSGHVWYMPVSTEPARALGELWCLPKVVGDLSIEREAGTTRLRVDVDDRHLLTLEVDRPRTVPLRLGGWVLSEWGEDAGETTRAEQGSLLRTRTRLRGDGGLRPLGGETSLTLGCHDRARRLADLGVGGRPLASVAADCEFVLEPGVSV